MNTAFKIIKIFSRILSVLLVLLFLVISGGIIIDSQQPTNADLKPYVQLFEYTAGKKVNYSVHFYNESDDGSGKKAGVVGMCVKVTKSLRYVTLDAQKWKYLSSTRKIFLVFHELAHCSLDLPHNEDMISKWCPRYLMNPYLVDPFCGRIYGMNYYLDTIVKESEKQGNKVQYFTKDKK